MTIKLLASSKRDGDHLHAIVAPALLGNEHPLYSVNGVFNAVFVNGNMLGDAMFYGSGAGKLPTASAVVADVVDEAKHLHRNIMTMWKMKAGTSSDRGYGKTFLCTDQRRRKNASGRNRSGIWSSDFCESGRS